ncbi:hypothetical protein [Microbacterium sp. TPD7012]|uniref:hypothetical protein n=1 Tax=Microbacterium sp. TPD7012 TaxID=2171975 RepID=UPI000D51B0C4|nr:hypothetical protein [Microbacterium sp. TPD7012]PVE91011.1 hypothetical protein DC434_19530 [Microbacterium sp. TPD7012]
MADDASTSSRRRRSGAGFGVRVLAALSVLVSGVIAFVLASSALELVREELHHNCEMQPPGSEAAGTWICADEIGYLATAGILGTGWLAVVLVGSLIALLVRRDRQTRLALVVLAALSTAWILGLTWYGSSTQVQDQYAPLTGAEYWVGAIGPAAVVSAIGLAVGMLSLQPTGPRSWILGIGATVLLIVATVLQPGLSIILVPAAGLLAAAVVRGVGAAAPVSEW